MGGTDEVEGTKVGGNVGGTGNAVGSRLDQEIDALTSDKSRFENKSRIQAQAIELIRDEWKRIKDPDIRGALVATYYPIFPRCVEDNVPEECLTDILKLPPRDVRKALKVRKWMYAKWKHEPNEAIYPTTGWFGDLLEFAKYNKVPTSMYFWAGVAVLGVCCRRNFMYEGFDKDYRLSNYIFLTGPKGAGKSGAREVLIDILERANRKIEEMHKAHDIRVRDVLSYTIPIFGADVTAASLVEKLAGHCEHDRLTNNPQGAPQKPRPGESLGLIDSDELGAFLGKDSHAVGTKTPMLTQMAFAENYRKSTKGGGEENAERLALSILACTAPEWMHATISGDALSGGFLDRVILVHRERSVRWGPRSKVTLLDPVKAEKLADWLVLLMVRYEDNYQMELTTEAQKWMDDWECRIHYAGPRDAGDSSKHSLERLSLHAVKLASLLCIADWNHEGEVPIVRLKHAAQAIELLEAEEEYREEFIAQATASPDEPDLQKIMAFIKSKGGKVAKNVFNSHGVFKGWDWQRRDYLIAALCSRFDLRTSKETARNNKMTEFYIVIEGRQE